MHADPPRAGSSPDAAPGRGRELAAFIVLAVLIWPFIAVGFVAAWGFVVWISQLLFFGPPGAR